MRIYTNPSLNNLWAYLQFLAVVIVLVILVSQAIKTWGNEPVLKQLLELIQTGKAEQVQPDK